MKIAKLKPRRGGSRTAPTIAERELLALWRAILRGDEAIEALQGSLAGLEAKQDRRRAELVALTRRVNEARKARAA